MGPRGDGGEGIGQFGVLITLLNLGLQRLSLDGRCWAITGAATWPAMALEASGQWLGTRRADNPAP